MRALVPALLLVACNGEADDTDAADGPPPLGEPIEAPPGEWSFVGFDDATCDDGSTTGIGVNPGSSDEVLVFFMGGGACWNYLTCFEMNFATHGPWQEDDLDQISRYFGDGTIFDREDPDNPYADFTFVYVPYCTGDIHGGDHVITYTEGDDSREYHHTGHSNVVAYLKRLGATWPDASKVVVSGASAGGGGATLNYPYFREYWPDAEMMLLDDSLPFFMADAIQSWQRETWIESWHLQPLMDEYCPGCMYDFSDIHTELPARYPDDRFGLLSSEQDETIRTYYLMSAERYEQELYRLDAEVLAPAGWKRFFVEGDSHTFVGDPDRFEAEGVPLWTWLRQMTEGDPAWKSVGP